MRLVFDASHRSDARRRVSVYDTLVPLTRTVLVGGQLARCEFPRMLFFDSRSGDGYVGHEPVRLFVGKHGGVERRHGKTIFRTHHAGPNLWSVCFGGAAGPRVMRRELDPIEAFWMTDFADGVPYFDPYATEDFTADADWRVHLDAAT